MENEKSLSSGGAENPRLPRGARRRARAGAGAKLGFYIHLAFYVGVNLLLLFINMVTTPLLWWSLWAVMGWGFALLIHALVSFSLPDLFSARRRLYRQELAREAEKSALSK